MLKMSCTPLSLETFLLVAPQAPWGSDGSEEQIFHLALCFVQRKGLPLCDHLEASEASAELFSS